MTTANSPVTKANSAQPSDPQKPHGRSSARTLRAGSDRAIRGLSAGSSKVAIIVDTAAIPRVSVMRVCWCRPARNDRTASTDRREGLVTLDRQSDHDQGREEHQDSDVEDEAQRRISLLRRAVHGAENAQADSDQVDETGSEHAQAKDHVELGGQFAGFGHHSRDPDQRQEDDDRGYSYGE